jgi:hypothetical protein
VTVTSLGAGRAVVVGAGLAAAAVVGAGVVTNAGGVSRWSSAGRSSPHSDTSRMTETQAMATPSQLGPRRPVWRPPMALGACSNSGGSGRSWAR